MINVLIRLYNRRQRILAVFLAGLLSPVMPEVARSQCPASLCSPNWSLPADAIIGWDGDHDAGYANMDGSYYVRDGRCLTVSFGIYANPGPGNLQWYNESGYLPCLTTKFERENCTIKISNFADKVTIPGNLGNDYVVIYSRVSVYNHDPTHQTHTLCPDPSPSPGPDLVALTSNSCTVGYGQTVTHDFAIAADRFGNTQIGWPNPTDLFNAGGWDTHYTHMATYWNNKLSGIVNITQLPDKTLLNAYKAGYIYTHIVRDGDCLKVGEGPWYDYQVFDRDSVSILANLLILGDFGPNFTDAQTLLASLSYDNADTAKYLYPWPWAIYLEKSGDQSFVTNHFDGIHDAVHSTSSDRTGPGGIMKVSPGLDSVNGAGFFTTDNWSALTGFAAYKYICNRLGNSDEENWATNEYNSLLTAVNNTLAATMTSFGITYLPAAMFDSNASRDPTDANWASMFMSGLWAWDGYLLGAKQSGVSLTNIDNTYDDGFLVGRAAGLAPHNFGAFIGGLGSYSSAYNAGFGSAALGGNKYRSEGIYAYKFMIDNGQSGPFCWHESFYPPDLQNPSPWAGTHPRAAIVGDSPHMWGQATATKVLIDSLIAEKIDQTNASVTSVIIGRGIPKTWVTGTNTQVIALSNFPIANNNRMGFSLRGYPGGQITLTLTGATPSGGTVLDLRAFWNNIASVTPPDCTYNNGTGTVTCPAGITSTTVTLINPNPTPIPTPSPLPTPAYTPPVGGTLIEAESGILHGCYEQAHSGASGGQRVDGLDAIGDYVKVTNFPNATRIKIRYASPYSGNFGLYVNNTRVASIPITATAPYPQGFDTYGEQAVNVAIPLNAEVRFQNDGYGVGDVPINLDCVVVDLIEMEEGQLSNNGVSVQPDYYASAGKYVFGLFGQDNQTRSVSFTNPPGFPAVGQFALRYSSFYSNSTINLYINDVLSKTITLPDVAFGGGTYGYGYKDVVVSIPQGAGVKFQVEPGNTGGAQYDCIILARKSEAEDATVNGCQRVSDPFASPYGQSGLRVDYLTSGDYISFASVRSGTYLAFRYAVCPADYGFMSLYINGQFRTHVFFRSTGSSPCTGDLFKDKIIPVDIHPGDTVKLQYDTGDSPVKLDYVRIY